MKSSALIIGGRGMVGRQLTKLCSEKFDDVCVIDTAVHRSERNNNVKYIQMNMEWNTSTGLIRDYDYVFHVAGIKGSPISAKQKPANYLPMLQFDTNIIRAVAYYEPKWFLYTSSIGVYPPMEIYEEDKVWDKVPSENDKIPAYIKRMGELSCEAISTTHRYNNISIVRPANIYGPHDNFGENSMVIPSLIKKAKENDILEIWGDGTPIRDFIHSEDVARGMLHMVENKVTEPVNLGSGKGVTISEIAMIISDYFKKPRVYDKSKPNGDMKRLMSMKRAEKYGFKPRISLKKGIEQTIKWYLNEI